MSRTSHQAEFDFGSARQIRIDRALRAVPAASRAVPLSDADRLVLTCMDSLALQIACEAKTMPADAVKHYVDTCVQAFVASLGDVAPEFSRETCRYLADSVSRLRQE